MHTLAGNRSDFNKETKKHSCTGDLLAGIVCIGVTAIVFVVVFGIWDKDMNIPYFSWGDSAQVNLLVSNEIQGGKWYVNQNAQYPFGAVGATYWDGILHVFEHIILGKLTGNIGVASWLYYFFTYIFTALFSYLALRALNLDKMLACAGGVIYAFLPFHYYRFGHIDLLDYTYIPVVLSFCFLIYEFHRKRLSWREVPRFQKGFIIFSGMCCLAQGMSSLYFTLFLILTICFMELVCILKYRSVRTVKYSGALIVCAVSGIACTLLISRVYSAKAEKQIESIEVVENANSKMDVFSPNGRTIWGVYKYSLRPYVMFLPVMGDRISYLDEFGRNTYNEADGGVEDDYMAPVGIVISIGIVAAGVIFLKRKVEDAVLEGASTLTIGLIFISMTFGFALFLGMLNPGIRSYNRMGVLIAFGALVVLLKLIEKGMYKIEHIGGKMILIMGLLTVALMSQTTPMAKKYVSHTPYEGLRFVDTYEDMAGHFYAARDFYQRIEEMQIEPIAYWNTRFEVNASWAVLYINSISSNIYANNKQYQEFWEWLGTKDIEQRISTILNLGYNGIIIGERDYGFDDDYKVLCSYFGEPQVKAVLIDQNVYLFDLSAAKEAWGITDIDRTEARERFYAEYKKYQEDGS